MAQGMKFCRNCGQQIPASAQFCRYCGYRFTDAPAPAAKGAASAPAPAEKPAPRAKAAAPVQPTAEIAPAVSEERVDAGRAGEFALELDAAEATTESAAGVSAPAGALATALGRFLGGIPGAFKKPKTLLFLLLMAVIWVVLALFRRSDAAAVQILSWLTFARGGQGRGVLGAVGGALGRGTVAAALASLFTGGLGHTLRGVGGIFKGSGEKRGLVPLLLGAVLGAALYLFFAGVQTASGATAMAGISGAVLALQALGKKGGGLYDLAAGLTSRAENGARVKRAGKAESLLLGLALGFAAAAALAAAL